MEVDDLENDYISRINTYVIENQILDTFSKQELKEFITEFEKLYLKEKLPYLQMINKSKSQYEEVSEIEEFFIEQIHYYFS
jgi:F0F1-type ATP synthase alpha subunit